MGIEKIVLQKLKSKARNKKLPFQLILQLFCQEEFLRRLSISSYSHQFILKGGLFLFAYNGFEGRPTMDIDLLARQVSNDQKDIQRHISEIIDMKTDNDYIIFEIKSVENIAEQKAYHGVRVKMLAMIDNTKTPFDIDVGIGDIIVPEENYLQLQTQLEGFTSPKLMSYSLESTIAEKLEAMFSRMETTSRMKDYYDIFSLASHYNFDGIVLRNAIFQTFENRETPCNLESLERIRLLYENDDMKKKWNAFIKKSIGVELSFTEVVDMIVQFIMEPIKAIVEGNSLDKIWKFEQGEYISK